MTLQPQPAFQATLAQSLSFGHVLEIVGKVRQDADSIEINFSKIKSSLDDINIDNELQFTLDFLNKRLIFTHKDQVITEELILAEFLHEFKFYIMLGETQFFIALNNKPFINLKYSRNFSKLQLQVLEIMGKLEYLRQLDHHKYFPHIWPPIQITDNYLDFSNDQPEPFQPGHIIRIKCRLEGNSKGRFIIHFRHARDNKRQELHVSVRFDTQTIVRNSKCRQGDDKLSFDDEEVDGFTFLFSRFGQEEADDAATVFPFADFNKPFTLAVAFCVNEFRLAKDGHLLFKYSYRSPNILRHIMGPKMFGTNGLNVRVWHVEHLCSDDEFCVDFEKYSL